MSVPPPSLTLAKPTWNMFYGSSNFSETQKTDRRTKLQTHNTLKPDWGFSGISWLQTVKTLSCIWDTCLITLTGYCTLSFWTGTSFRWSKLRNKCLKRGEFFTREEIMTCLKTKSMGSESGWISTVKTDKKHILILLNIKHNAEGCNDQVTAQSESLSPSLSASFTSALNLYSWSQPMYASLMK